MLGRTDSRTRALAAPRGLRGCGGGAWACASRVLAGRPGHELAALAVKQSSRIAETILVRRGSIYDRTRDRRPRDKRQARPPRGEPEAAERRARAEVARSLVEAAGPRGDDAANLTARMTSEREYVVLARGLEPGDRRTRSGSCDGDRPEFSGLILEREPERQYPQGGGGPETSLAAHLLGFVNREGDGPVRRRAVLPGRGSRDSAPGRGADATRRATPCRDRRR